MPVNLSQLVGQRIRYVVPRTARSLWHGRVIAVDQQRGQLRVALEEPRYEGEEEWITIAALRSVYDDERKIWQEIRPSDRMSR
jgi:hypothetical protein